MRQLLLSLAVLASMLAGCSMGTTPAPATLVLATTTSTADSGLLDAILPDFERRQSATVRVVAVGTGEALALGENGDADVLLVHARAQEDEFVARGFGVERQEVMYNDFVIVGPEADPAAIAGMDDGAAALARIAAAGAPFVSRGDESGTHAKEMSLWAAAGITPGGAWYRSAGQGMGAVLTMAEEQSAYTLADRGTYLARRAKGYTLPVLVEGDERLFNPYGVILVNPARHPTVKAELGRAFIAWLTSVETQRQIEAFGREQFGQSLFVPNSAAWRSK